MLGRWAHRVGRALRFPGRLSGELSSQEGRSPSPPSGKTGEPALGRLAGRSRSHLSFTSSFTPELAWRAWFITSYTRWQSFEWVGKRTACEERGHPQWTSPGAREVRPRARTPGPPPTLPPLTCRGRLAAARRLSAEGGAACTQPSAPGAPAPWSSPRFSAPHLRWPQTWPPSPCPPQPRVPPDARPGSWASAPGGCGNPGVRGGGFHLPPPHRAWERDWGRRALESSALYPPTPCPTATGSAREHLFSPNWKEVQRS